MGARLWQATLVVADAVKRATITVGTVVATYVAAVATGVVAVVYNLGHLWFRLAKELAIKDKRRTGVGPLLVYQNEYVGWFMLLQCMSGFVFAYSFLGCIVAEVWPNQHCAHPLWYILYAATFEAGLMCLLLVEAVRPDYETGSYYKRLIAMLHFVVIISIGTNLYGIYVLERSYSTQKQVNTDSCYTRAPVLYWIYALQVGFSMLTQVIMFLYLWLFYIPSLLLQRKRLQKTLR